MQTRPHDAASAIQSADVLGSHEPEFGLTKREYFAAEAMQGLLATITPSHSLSLLAKTSVEVADALIKALNESEADE